MATPYFSSPAMFWYLRWPDSFLRCEKDTVYKTTIAPFNSYYSRNTYTWHGLVWWTFHPFSASCTHTRTTKVDWAGAAISNVKDPFQLYHIFCLVKHIVVRTLEYQQFKWLVTKRPEDITRHFCLSNCKIGRATKWSAIFANDYKLSSCRQEHNCNHLLLSTSRIDAGVGAIHPVQIVQHQFKPAFHHSPYNF